MNNKVRWYVIDENTSSIHKTKKMAIKEYMRLINSNYKYSYSLKILRHDVKNDIYTEIKIKGVKNGEIG